MANLVMKRKDAEVTSHGFSIFLDPKRVKLQDVEILDIMEEDKPLADADAPPANVQPTMFMPSLSLVLPTQCQEAVVHGYTVGTAPGSKCSEPPFSEDQAAPMDEEADVRQCQPLAQPPQQPGQRAPFFSGFF